MEVALFNSPILPFKDKGFYESTSFLGISSIYGYLHKKGIDTKLFDLNIILMENKELYLLFNKIDSTQNIEEFILKNKDRINAITEYLISKIEIKDCKFIGISIIEPQSIKIMIPFMKRIKEKFPEKIIVVGGLVNSLIDDKYLINKTMDFIAEGEEPLYLLTKAIKGRLDINKVPAIKYYNGKEIVHTPTISKFDLINQTLKFNKPDIDKYRFLTDFYNNHNNIFNVPIFPYKMSRGCTFRCSFCSSGGGILVHKQPEQIVGDLKDIKKEYKYKYFYFFNQHISISKDFINELCDHIIDSRLNILWSDCIKPLSYLSQKLYYKLREAGCIRLSYGIETGSSRLMELMNKGHTVLDCENNLRYADKAGIWTEPFFVVGLPTETENEFNKTMEFIGKNKKFIDTVAVNKFRLEEGSQIMKNPEKFGIQIRKKINGITPYSVKSLSEYSEINGMKHEELQNVAEERHGKIYQLFDSSKYYAKDYYLSRNMIFPLYDHLVSKEKVRNFFINNFDIINGYKNNFGSLFTGTSSNQKIKGNLHLCSVDEFNLVSFDKLVNRMEEIYNSGYKKLIIFGGEPLIRKDIFKLLSKAKKIRLEYIIIKTNARMLKYKNFCNQLSKYVDEILVISPSTDECEYDKISGVKGSFSQFMEGIKNWKRLNKKLRYYSK